MNSFRTLSVSMLALAALIVASPVARSQTAPADATPAPAADSTAKKDDVVVMDKFIASGDTNMASVPSGSVFGFDKSVEETPRVVSIVSDAQLQSLNILKSEDVVKADPSTYSNFRFGLQGTVTIRNQSSDFFFNGMRRIDPQGIFESVWGAYDSLQIVEGPESTVYGLGRLGGYINFIPKSARAANNSYITTDAANISVQYGSWNTSILKVDYQTPVTLFGKPGGLSLFVEMKNSDGYKANGFSRQQLIQGGYTVDVTPDWRAEVGFSFQISNGGLPGGDNRTLANTTQQQVYWSGNFSYQMDENGDGKIDEKEKRDAYFWGTPQTSVQIPSAPTTVAPANYSSISAAGNATVSVVNGAPSATSPGLFRPSLIMDVGVNDSLYRTIPWQGGAVAQNTGNWTQDGGLTSHTGPITMAQYMAGYTDSAAPALVGKAPVQRLGFQMMFYPSTSDNFANYIPGVTKSGSIPYKGIQYAYWLPPTMDLNPTSFVAKPWNKKMSLGEDYYLAHIPAFYFNLINDQNADYTIKDQVFIDSNDQTKSGSNAYSQTQHPTTFEDKLTFTKKYNPFSWLSVQALGSANYWQCWTALVQNSGDSDIDMRRDLQRAGPTGQVNSIEDTFTSNDRWYGMVESSSYTNGLPVSYNLQNNYSVTGIGAELDTVLFKKFDLTTGLRWDYIAATAIIPAGVMDLGATGSESVAYLGPLNTSSGVPSTYIGGTGSYIPYSQYAYGNSNGGSETVSLSYSGPYDTHPYITYANTASLQNGTGSGTWSPQTVKNSILGRTILFEVGVKGSLFKQLSYSFDYYNQFRADFQPLTTTGGGTANNISRGEEAKLTYQASKKLTFSLGGNWSLVHNEQGGSVTEPASAFGAPDVIDPATGRVLIPADALTWGGRIQTTIPDSDPRYRRAAGIPAAIVTATVNYDIGGGFYVGSTLYYQSKFSLDRLDTMWVPDGHTFDGVFGYRTKKWEAFINATNMFNASIYNFAGFATWIDPKFQRALAVTIERHF